MRSSSTSDCHRHIVIHSLPVAKSDGAHTLASVLEVVFSCLETCVASNIQHIYIYIYVYIYI